MMQIKGKEVKLVRPKWDRCARKSDLSIGTKQASLPLVAPWAITRGDSTIIHSFISANKDEAEHVKMFVTRIIDADKTIRPILQEIEEGKKTGQKTLTGEPAYKYYDDFVKQVPILIDPSTEYTWYDMYRKELATNPDIPLEIRKLAERIDALAIQCEKGKITKAKFISEQEKEYEKFWHGLIDDEKLLADIVTKMLNVEHGLGADIGLPPVPVTYSPKLLEVTKRINRFAQHIWAGQNCAAYIIITPEFVDNEFLLNKLIEYLDEIPNKFIVLKIKNSPFHLPTYVQQKLFCRKIMEAMIKIKQKPKAEKVFILLEAAYQMYPSMIGGFDIVSTSLRGYDKDTKGGNPANEGLGGWFDPKYLISRNIRDVKYIIQKNGGLKCSCEICIRIKKINRQTWNWQRRVHFLYTITKLVAEIHDFIGAQRIEMARSKLVNSALSNCKIMLPLLSEE